MMEQPIYGIRFTLDRPGRHVDGAKVFHSKEDLADFILSNLIENDTEITISDMRVVTIDTYNKED